MEATRDRLLFAAMQLFAEKGYLSTSVADILKSAGANSGSLYHYFPTKQDVLVAVLEAYRDGIEPMLLAPAWKGVDDPIERIFALLGAYRGMLAQSDCMYGCPIGSIALELHEPDPPVRELLSINFDGWVDHVQRCFDQARDRLPAGTDTRKLAIFTLTTMEGGVMQSRTHRSLDAFDACIETLRDYVNRLQTAPTRGRPRDEKSSVGTAARKPRRSRDDSGRRGRTQLA
ncbi:MAG: regulatory protein TetR [Rhodospirillales bacterium]|nr:regulatory protein TetR [Rhodospirillales bacterium]